MSAEHSSQLEQELFLKGGKDLFPSPRSLLLGVARGYIQYLYLLQAFWGSLGLPGHKAQVVVYLYFSVDQL